MRSLSRSSKGRVCPGSPDNALSVLKVLPLEVRNVASSLNPDDSEVLAYLISFSSQSDTHSHKCKRVRKQSDVYKPSVNDGFCSSDFSTAQSLKISQVGGCRTTVNTAVQLRKAPLFGCGCFECYKCFWSRWDSSPDRETIGEAIALYEELFLLNGKGRKKHSGDSDAKVDKRLEGRGKGRRGQEKNRQREQVAMTNAKNEVLNLAATESNAVGRARAQAQVAASPSVDIVDMKKTVIDDRNRRESHGSMKKGNDAPSHRGMESHMITAKDDLPGKLMSSRVAPVGLQSQGREENLVSSEFDSKDDGLDTEDPMSLHKGRKLVNLVAERIWGLWERKAKRMDDMC